MKVPSVLQPCWHSLSGVVLDKLSQSSFLGNGAVLKSTAAKGAAWAVKFFLVTPVLTACAAIDLLWWTVRTVIVLPIFIDGPTHHFTDLLSTLVLPITAFVCALFNQLPTAHRPAFQQQSPASGISTLMIRGEYRTPEEIAELFVNEGVNPAEPIGTFEGTILYSTGFGSRNSALHYCLQNNLLKMAQTLLQHMDPSMDIHGRGGNNESVLEAACTGWLKNPYLIDLSHPQIFELLLSRNICKSYATEVLKKIIKDVPPNTLHYYEIIELLLKHGADPNGGTIQKGYSDTPASFLTFAIREREDKLIELLIKYGANVNDPQDPAFSEALLKDRDAVLPAIIQAMVDQGKAAGYDAVNVVYANGTTPLTHAMMRTRAKAIELLEKVGARFECIFPYVDELDDLWEESRKITDGVARWKMVSEAIKPIHGRTTHPNPFFNAIRIHAGWPAGIKLFIKEKGKGLKEIFDQFADKVNMPQDILNIISNYL